MKKTKEECLLMNGIMNIDLGNNAARIMQAMEDYANDAVEQVKTCNKPAVSGALPSEKKYEIDFGGNVLTEISIINNEMNVIQAINGYGDAVEKDKIRISERQ